ncbi:hypothetical protein DMA11_01895 [Marinilabiliaceae bacterium JC017]|nr:hypothetical protein DMA11_01895 [Marinilabiliaceae bacterium JC017]
MKRENTQIRKYIGWCLLLGSMPLCWAIPGCSSKVMIDTTYVKNEEVYQLQIKFCKLLNVLPDSIRHLTLYKHIDHWPGYVAANPDDTAGYNARFIQYLYYMAYDTKLPGNIEKLYHYPGTFLFKSTDYLQEGNLLFLKQKEREDKQVALYLQNKYFVLSDVDGGIKYYHLSDTCSVIDIIANAKIKRNVKSQP